MKNMLFLLITLASSTLLAEDLRILSTTQIVRQTIEIKLGATNCKERQSGVGANGRWDGILCVLRLDLPYKSEILGTGTGSMVDMMSFYRGDGDSKSEKVYTYVYIMPLEGADKQGAYRALAAGELKAILIYQGPQLE